MCLTIGQGEALLPCFYGTMVGPWWYQTAPRPAPGSEGVSKTVGLGRAVGVF